ncbi:citryl-CoA lyase [Planosporangium mesophilum]|uniref:citrate synthase (unknown stereospecificity) n=1 Tax=Planosporangium mesophilum TaxID=689768 RepID=A0A8J3X0F1_9ACTN|nr:citryl-CoA lyase [Planosporangium mesophilum]NJC86276.1 citryl-CoA lyase [Planosporangium mesophilum]GII23315.1 citryl-CoA lyase [Planosporangium mesophilum]
MSTTYRTSLGTSDLHSIRLMGRDLSGELMGEVPFGDLAFWMVAMRRPTPGESRLFNAVLVALADHGFTPTVIAARMTLASAPESIQGAMSAGLLGGGSRFLGVTEDAARFLAEGLAGAGADGPRADADYDALARELLAARTGDRRPIPGLGHPVHKDGDPRTPVIYRIAEEEKVLGPHLALLAAVGRVHPEILGRTLPINGAGVCGAALADLGFPPLIARGFALVARAAGVLAHIAEEMRDPIGLQLYQAVDRNAEYVDPTKE